MQAVVLAGGKGARLHPYSATLPKPLMPLGEMPVLEVLLRQLRRYGVEDVVLAVGHLGHLVQAYFGDGERFGVRLAYSFEQTPLGTAGPIAAVLDRMTGDFIVANGDLLTTLNIRNLIEAHQKSDADATIGILERQWKSDFGLIEVGPGMTFRDYREKPVQTHFVSMGIYVLRRDAVRDHVRAYTYLDMPSLMLTMRDEGKKISCFTEDCYWLDIGRPEDFALAQQAFADERSRFLGEE